MKKDSTNSLPFILLLFVHITFLIYTFYKIKDRKSLFILLLSNIGFAYLFEFFTFNLFRSYQYKPKFLKKRFLDNILGAFLSQGVFLPFTSIFISAFGYGWKVKVGFAMYFSIIERIFIKLGIFSNNWWRTLYTFFCIPLYFQISDFWYRGLKRGNKPILFTSLIMMTWVTGVSLLNVLAVIRKVKFGMGYFYTWKEHFILAPLYWFFVSLFSSLSLINETNSVGKIRTFIFMKLLDFFLSKRGIVKPNQNNLFTNNALQLSMVFITGKYKEWVYKEQTDNLES